MATIEQINALNRFGLGARYSQAESIRPTPWLQAQVTPRAVLLEGTNLGTVEDLVGQAVSVRRSKPGGQGREELRRIGREQAQREIEAVVIHSLTTQMPYAERLVRFWSNHLCVSGVGEPLVQATAGVYEREVIRVHLFGKFEDMVLASASHPAMLIYLDQARSVGPNSRAAQRNDSFGLNENYARELMELHTIGVGGGYSQSDVEQLALMLTGWTVPGVASRAKADPKPFEFTPYYHEPGSKTLLGRTFTENGEQEARDAIRFLVSLPQTATFIATKLVRHFVSDNPPNEAVEEIAAVFRNSGGDLRQVSLALVGLEEALTLKFRKIRTPQEFAIAIGRALGVKKVPEGFIRLLGQLRHQYWSPLSPAGYSDMTQDWSDPDSLLKRAEFARQVAKKMAGRLKISPLELAQSVIGIRDLNNFKAAIAAQENNEDALAILFASPDFQWR